MKKIALMLMMVLELIPTMWAGISVQTKIYDASSQPPIVGGMINGFSEDLIIKKGILVSTSNDNLIYEAKSELSNPYFFEDLTKEENTYSTQVSLDFRTIDCSDIGKEQFWCSLLMLDSEKTYYVRAYAVKDDGSIIYGQTEILSSQSFNRYNGSFDYANVWHAFDYTLFDLITDEIINPNEGFYYSTNESPKTVKHQVGTGYNTCYKFATEWNYKLWYYHSSHCDRQKMVCNPLMSYENGKLTIEKNPIDSDKDISIYYCINGNYFRPETYSEVYTVPIEITEPCAIYCYAISSEGYISYTSMYVVETISNDIAVQTKIFDANSQPILVGGFIENYSKQNVSKKGIIVSKNADDMIITDDTVFDNATFFLQGKTTGRINNPYDIRFIDCTETNEEQFACALQFLMGNTDYYVKVFVIDKDNNVLYGNTEKVHTQDFNRYDGWADYANVYYYSSYTLFDVVTDEIIDKDKGYYSTTNESPTTVSYRTGDGVVYKLATEWNYKLWYSQVYSGTLENNSSKVVHLPVMRYAGGLLTIEKNPLDADKDITIYYSINGNYFRPETYTDVYIAPIYISEPCAVYCYAISSDGYISYTNLYVIGDYTIKNEDGGDSEYGTVAEGVDLGLSVKWASWNVGAESPEGLGNLYAWGELSPKTDYSTSSYKFYDNGYTKYGSVDNKYQLESEDDVARQGWGDKWRIPTFEELKELKEKCTFTKTELNGVPVTKVTGPNENYIYFPYPGNFTGTTLYYENSIGSYWSSDLESDSYAKDLDFMNGTPSLNGDSRYHGQSIRPVYVEQADDTFGKVPDIIDLGLSSGTLWASWNLGASSPEEYGAYFAWGETVPKDNYDWSTYKFGSEQHFTKYNSIDGLTELELEDDAANAILGKDWRMPTHKEELELVNECSWESMELNGISGYKVTGPNGNSIFMPRGGLYDGTDYDGDGTTISNVNTCGWYWSSTLNSVGSAYAQGLCFYPSLLTNVSDHERCDGHNIRPVYIRRLTPADDNGDVDYGNGDIDENTDLNGNVVGNIYYNISDENGEYSSTEGCIILKKPTSDTDMSNLEGQDIFGEDFKNGYTGIVFMIQAGSGTIKVNAETVGNMTLKVKIGNNAPITMKLEGKIKTLFPYTVTAPTYVYIYCGETSSANTRGLRKAPNNGDALKIYGIEWSNKDDVNSFIDYNEDGQMNVSDVVTLISCISRNDFTSISKTAADVNGDGDVNVTDVVTLILMIANY